MNIIKTVKRDLYYTGNHEWIDFQGSVAYVGITSHKIVRIGDIVEVNFEENPGYLKQGQLLCNFQYENGSVAVFMPVEGKIMRINEELVEQKNKNLMEHSRVNGWLALIVPSQPYNRQGLLQTEQYHQLVKKSK